MSFVSPMIFWIGLGTVSVPIIIHLLNRRRFRVRQWAAMQFLLDSLRRNRRRLRIEELILMALRCLVLFLLAMAIARFTGCGDQDLMPGADHAPEATVFILDDSFSMGQKAGGPTVLENAVEDICTQIQRITENSKADQIAVLLTSKPSADDAFQTLMPVSGEEEVEQLIARLRGVKTSDSPTRLGEAMTAAGEMLASQDKPKNVFVFSDFRTVDLGVDKAGLHQEVFKKLRRQAVRIVTLDYGRKAKMNLTVEKIEMIDKWALVGVETRIGVTVRNNASRVRKNVSVTLSARWQADDPDEKVELPGELIPEIGSNSSVRVEFTVQLPKIGPAVLTAQLPSDDLVGDNAGYLALDVRKSLRVLLVDGHPDMTDPELSESYRLSLLLDPRKDKSHGNDVTVVPLESLDAQDFRDYDLVVLLDVAKLPSLMDDDGNMTYPLLSSLEQYVRDGGGLAIFTGANVNVAFYKGPMYAEGLGLSPLVISPPRGDAAAKEKYRRLDVRSIAGDAFLSSLRGEGGAIRCGIIRFYAYTPADPMTRSSAADGDVKPPRVVAKFTTPDGGDGPPAIVTRQFGRGLTMMMYSTASTRWNDWADDVPESAYSAPMIDMMHYLARSQAGMYTLRVGETIVHTIDRELRDADVTLRTPMFPADDVITLKPTTVKAADGQAVDRVVTYENPAHAGCYTMSLTMPDGTKNDMFFARNIDPAEGELWPGGEKLIVRAMGSDDFKYVSRVTAGSVEDVQTKEQKEYWLAILIALLTFLAVETFLAQRFGHYTGS